MKKLLLVFSHGAMLVLGFAAGIYALPILIAPAAPTANEVEALAGGAMFSGEFRRDLAGSDALHWGEGKLSITADSISLEGELAPGPDYRLYLSPQFVETEADFNALKSEMKYVGDVKTFKNFIVDVPANIDPTEYKAAIVWCETFGQFITAASYQ